MTIGEFFINLGIKGADTAGKALGGVKSGLGDVKSMSLEAKAAIIGVVYGLEQLMSHSAQMGTDLTNFNALTGMSTKELQQWQYAARQAGVSGEEMTGSLKAVQNAMTNMLLGKGAPEGMAMLANKVGFDPAKARDTMYVMGQLQKFAQAVPKDVGNNMLKSFGISEGTIAAMRRNAFTPQAFAKAPTYSNGEIGQLDKVNVAWSNLGNKIQMAFGHLTAKEGLPIIKDISMLTDKVLALIEAFVKLSEKLKLFEVIGKVFEGWGIIFDGISSAVDKLTGTTEEAAGKDKKLKKNPVSMLSDWVGGKIDDYYYLQDQKKGLHPQVTPHMKPDTTKNTTQNIEVNQNLHFQHDGKDHKKTGDSVHSAVKGAYRQMQAQSQGA